MNQEPVFLFGAHKSGTTLLRSLFDGHPRIFSIPIETHPFKHLGMWIGYEWRSQLPIKRNINDIRNAFKEWIRLANNSNSKYGGSRGYKIFDETLFNDSISRLDRDHSIKEIIEMYFTSIYFSIYNRDIENGIRIVEKSVENAEFGIFLHHIFPKAKFIHIIRNPYSNVISLRKYQSSQSNLPYIGRGIQTLKDSFKHLYQNKALIKNYYILRYEDLITQPKIEINKICNFLNLEFNSKLLAPTILGENWKGNSTSDSVFNGIDSSNLSKWESEITPLEIYFINKLFPFIINDYGYKPCNNSGSIFKPIPGEKLRNYVKNRLYRYYC